MTSFLFKGTFKFLFFLFSSLIKCIMKLNLLSTYFFMLFFLSISTFMYHNNKFLMYYGPNKAFRWYKRNKNSMAKGFHILFKSNFHVDMVVIQSSYPHSVILQYDEHEKTSLFCIFKQKIKFQSIKMFTTSFSPLFFK